MPLRKTGMPSNKAALLGASLAALTVAATAPALAEGKPTEDDPKIEARARGRSAGAADVARDAMLLRYAAVVDSVFVDGEPRRVEMVDATKTPTPLIDTPQSVSILTGAQIAEQAFIDLGDVLRYTPGASIGQGEGHRDQITIRGQNTTADFFIDGLRDDVQYFRPLYNLERVEILRGANALLFGRGGGGGIVNRVTKAPTQGETFAEGAASVDTFGAALFAGDVNYALSGDSAFRLNAFHESLANHRDFFDGDRYAVNPTFRTALSPDTTIIFSYEHIRDERVVDRGVPSLGDSPLRGVDEVFFGDRDANFTELTANIARARIEHRLSDMFRADATVQYADYDKIYQNVFAVGFDDVAETVTFDGYRDPTERQNLIVQGNLVGEFTTAGVGHTLLTGVEYGRQDTANSRQNAFFPVSGPVSGTNRVTFPFSEILSPPPVAFPVTSRDTRSDAVFLSAYFQDQIDLGLVQLVAGVRYDRFDIDVVDVVEVNDGPGDGNDGFLARVDEQWSPRFGAIFEPTDALSIYASFGQSFLPRAGDQFLSLTPTTETLEPERFDNYEVGVKWDIAARLSFTAALFRLDRENGVTVDPADPRNSLVIGSRTEGVEAQLTGEVTPWWRVNAAYSYLDARERGRIVGGALANRDLAQAPQHMASVWNRIDATDRLGFGLGVTHQSAQFASISNAVELPAFTRVDAAAFYRLTDRIEVQVNVENLLDTDYFPAAHNDDNISTGEPLNARVSLRGRL